jgi:Fe-S-cluster containining protein
MTTRSHDPPPQPRPANEAPQDVESAGGLKYECDHCGACCEKLLVEAYEIDVLREPRLILADPRTVNRPEEEVMEELREDGTCLLIAGPYKCKFRSSQCQIYHVRPTVCVAMEAGDDQCQAARKESGLPPLAQYVPPEDPPESDLKGYPWPASRLTVEDMEMLCQLRDQTGKPIHEHCRNLSGVGGCGIRQDLMNVVAMFGLKFFGELAPPVIIQFLEMPLVF